MDGTIPSHAARAEEVVANASEERSYFFRGDDQYRGGPVGRDFGAEADAADIQNPADHVLRKESNRSSRYTSFTTETKIARRFTSAEDHRYVRKVDMIRLRELESLGTIRIWTPDLVHAELSQGPRKLAKQAADVRTAMRRNREILVEGQIPEHLIEFVS
jgi:hypothetical protein